MFLKYIRGSIPFVSALTGSYRGSRVCVFSDSPVLRRSIVDSASCASPGTVPGILKGLEEQVVIQKEIVAVQAHLAHLESEETKKPEKPHSELVADRKFFRKQLELLRELLLPEQAEGYTTGGWRAEACACIAKQMWR